MSIKQIKSLVQFARGSKLVWETLTTPIPNGVVVFSIDDGVFKLGDGVTTYVNLPVLFTYNDLVVAEGGASGLFKTPTIDDQGEICVVSLNTTTGTMEYSPSGTTLASLLDSLTALEATNDAQNAIISATLAEALSIDSSINTASDDMLVIINNGRYSASGLSVADLENQIAASMTETVVTGAHIEDVKFYTTQDMTLEVDKCQLSDNTTYYANIVGFHDVTDTPGYYLTTDSADVTITPIGGSTPNLFSVQLNGVAAGAASRPVVLVAGMNDGAGSSITKKPITITVNDLGGILLGVYGSLGMDTFAAVAVDSNNNIFCVGESYDASWNQYASIVKLDDDFNVLAKKRSSSTDFRKFNGVAIDSAGNVICIADSSSGGGHVIKFDNNLTIVYKKVYAEATFYGVAVDSSNNIICVGSTTEGAGSAFVIKFDPNMAILARKYYGGAGTDIFRSVIADSNGNIICVGETTSEGTSSSALIVRFDSNLAIIARKYYGGAAGDYFYGVAVDSSNNIYAVGYTGDSPSAALVVKFDTALAVISAKTFGGTSDERFHDVAVDSNGDIACIGYVAAEGAGVFDIVLIKFDSSLNVIAKKIAGSANDEIGYGITIDNFNNMLCVGYDGSGTFGMYTGFVGKFSSTIPSGTYTGSVLTGITVADSGLTTADSTLTAANSTLTLTDSVQTLSDNTLALTDSTLNFNKEAFV